LSSQAGSFGQKILSLYQLKQCWNTF